MTQRYVHLDKALLMAADKVAEEIDRTLESDEAGRRPMRSPTGTAEESHHDARP